MCQKCRDATEAASFVVGQNMAGYLLWNETSFPFGCGDEVARQMAEAVDRAVGLIPIDPEESEPA